MKGPEATEALGARLARARPPAGEPLATIHLRGELGSGKTTLARGFVRACGVGESIPSPTYTLLQVFRSPAHILLHLDLYRLERPAELEYLGVREWARSGSIWLIEWPERATGRLPPADLIVSLEAGDEAHQAVLAAGTDPGAEWLARVEAEAKEGTHG